MFKFNRTSLQCRLALAVPVQTQGCRRESISRLLLFVGSIHGAVCVGVRGHGSDKDTWRDENMLMEHSCLFPITAEKIICQRFPECFLLVAVRRRAGDFFQIDRLH